MISAISEGLFRNQDLDYQQELLSPGIKKLGLTAGLPDSLECLIGNDGMVWGLNHFGYSAPAGVLDEKFGFTAENVVDQVKAFLNI